MTQRTLDSRRISYLLLILLFCTYAFTCMTKNCFSSAMVFIVDEGILTKFETGVITAAFYLVYAVLQIFAGVIIDKWNPEHFITVGLVGAAAANLVIFFNQNYIVMLVSWTLNAIIQAAVWPATFKMISTMLVDDMRQNALFVITFGNPVGVVSCYVMAAIVSAAWEMNFLVSAVGLLINAVIFEVCLRGIEPHLIKVKIEAPSTAENEKNETRGSFLPLAISSGLIIVMIISFIRTMFDIGIKSLIPTMINESYESVTPVIATALNVIILVAGALGPCVARLLYPRFIKNEAVAVLCFFLAALPMSLASLLLGRIDYLIIVVMFALFVMLMSGCSIFTSSYIAARFNKWGKGGTVAGLINCTASLGIVVSNTLFTALADGIGWFGTGVIWVVTMVLTLLLILVFVPIWTKFLKKSDA